MQPLLDHPGTVLGTRDVEMRKVWCLGWTDAPEIRGCMGACLPLGDSPPKTNPLRVFREVNTMKEKAKEPTDFLSWEKRSEEAGQLGRRKASWGVGERALGLADGIEPLTMEALYCSYLC